MDAGRIAGDILHCCQELCDCAGCTSEVAPQRCGKVVQIVFLIVSFLFGVFDSFTDWNAWVSLRSDNFGLVQVPEALIQAWLGFTIMGTVLFVVSLLNDLMDLLCISTSKIDDLKSKCYGSFGFNSLTRSEILAFLNTIFEDVPLLILTCVYVVIRQVICVGVDLSQNPESHTADYRDLYISAVVTTAVIIYRTFRSFYRLGYSHDHCYCPAPPEEEKLCSPECCKSSCGHICGGKKSWNGCFVVYGFILFVYVVLVILALAVVGFGGYTISSILGGMAGGQTTVDWNITHSHPNMHVQSQVELYPLLYSGSGSSEYETDPLTVHTVAVTDISVVSGTAVLLRNGSLSVTEVFRTDLNQTTYCFVYFAFQRSEIVFNVAHISEQHSAKQSCVCNHDSTPCDRYYENLFISLGSTNSNGTILFENVLRDLFPSCPLSLKPIHRDRNLQVKCNCNFKMVQNN